jgi:hypothetical protein
MQPRPDPRIRAMIENRLQEPAEPIERPWEAPTDIPPSADGEPNLAPAAASAVLRLVCPPAWHEDQKGFRARI